MKINFRQGLISAEIGQQFQPSYLVSNSSGVSLRTVNRPVIFTVANGPKDYTVGYYKDLLAWPTLMLNGITHGWLYIDINRSTSARTYGVTTVAPISSSVVPESPADNQHWFDRSTVTMKVYNSTTAVWTPVIRIFAGKYTAGTVETYPIGTQVGISSVSAASGTIMVDSFGVAIKDSRGHFVTTEDVLTIDGAATHSAKLDASVITAEAGGNIPAFYIVKYDQSGKLVLANYEDVGMATIGVATVDAATFEPVSLIISGKVFNANWNWPAPNQNLWVGTLGQLVTVDPYVNPGKPVRHAPVARTLDTHSIIFDPGFGLAGEKGDKGEQGPVGAVEDASIAEKGIVKLSVAPADESNPTVVGINDPILTAPRTPLPHVHTAAQTTVVPTGGVTATDVQQALVSLDVASSTVKTRVDGLSSTTDQSTGAGAIGYNETLAYPNNTVGNKLKTLPTTAQINAAITAHNDSVTAHPALTALATSEANRSEAAATASLESSVNSQNSATASASYLALLKKQMSATGGYRVGFIGESLTEHHHTANNSRKLSSWSRGFLNWAQVLNPGLFTFDVWYDPTSRPGWEPSGVGSSVFFRGANAGVGGQTSAQILARKEFLVDNLDVDIVIISTGTNSMSTDTKEAVCAQRDATVDYYLDAGKMVILLPILMRDTSSWTLVSGYREKCNYVNQKAYDLARSRANVHIFDWNQHWIDFNNVDGNPKAGFSPDGIHFNVTSGYYLGVKFAEFLKTLVPYTPIYNVVAPNDLFSGNNPLGNKMPNPMMTGTTGTVSAPVTGQIATSFRALRNTAIGCACVGSKEVRADGRGSYQVLTMTPNQAVGTELFYFQTSSTDIAHGLPLDTWVRASVEVDLSAWDGWQGVTMHLRDNAAAGILSYGMEIYNTDQWPTAGWKGLIQTPAFQLKDAASTLRWMLQIRVDNAKSGSGVIKIGAAELRAVADPRVLMNYRGE